MDEKKLTIREFLAKWRSGGFNSSVDSMIEAGWFDWFCKDGQLHGRLSRMIPLIEPLENTPLADTCYLYFKNNSPLNGDLYDSFGVNLIAADGEQVFWVTGRCGHSGQAEVYSAKDKFHENLLEAGMTPDGVRHFWWGLTEIEYKEYMGYAELEYAAIQARKAAKAVKESA